MSKWLLGIILLSSIAAAGTEPVRLNVWSGQEQSISVPAQGAWQILAEHGRILAAGEGDVVVNFPALTQDSHLDVELLYLQSDKRTPLRIWAPQLLFGKTAHFELDRPQLKKTFAGLGVKDSDEDYDLFITDTFHSEPGKITLVFPDQYEFPLKLGNWSEITVGRAGGGSLGISLDQREQVADTHGNAGYIRIRDAESGAATILFSPGFDLSSIQNVIVLRQLIKEDSK